MRGAVVHYASMKISDEQSSYREHVKSDEFDCKGDPKPR